MLTFDITGITTYGYKSKLIILDLYTDKSFPWKAWSKTLVHL